MYSKKIIVYLLLIIPLIAGVIGSDLWAAGSEEKITCPNCSLDNEANSKFCIRCGNVLHKPKPKENQIPIDFMPEETILEVGMSRSFHLRDGNIISGTITEIQGDTMTVIETPDGMLRIPAKDILAEKVDLSKTDFTRFVGAVLSEDDFSISIKTSYGVVVILKRDIQTMDRYYGDKKESWQEEKKRFHSVEELIDIFSDPTAFPLQIHTVYLSGLSLGYGFTDNFMLRSQFGYDLVGDLNLHPFYRVLHKTTGTSEMSIGIGAKLYNRHKIKIQADKYSHWIIDEGKTENNRLSDANSTNVEDALKERDKKEFFADLYIVLSSRESLSSGRGKWGWHIGAQTSTMIFNKPELIEGYKWDDQFAAPYRIWTAMDYDLNKKLKFLIEMFADNGYKFIEFQDVADSYFGSSGEAFTIETQAGEYQPLSLDFGFLHTVNQTFRYSVHFQAPFVIFYWKW